MLYTLVRLMLSFLPLGGLSGVNLGLLLPERVPGGVGLLILPVDCVAVCVLEISLL